MKEIFSNTKIFTVLLAISYMAGLCGYFYNVEMLAVCLVFACLCAFVFFVDLSIKKLLVLCFIFFLGLLRASDSSKLPSVFDEITTNEAYICGQIVSSKDISYKNNRIKFYLNAKSAEISHKEYQDLNTKFLVSMDNSKELENAISIGDYACVAGKMRHPYPSTNPHQFDYHRYLLNNDTKNILYADSFKKTAEPDFKSDRWYFILKEFEKTRNKIIEKHSKNIKSPRLEILGGIVFGNETINPDEEIKESFRNSGLLHLLAASGLNVALIYGIWWWIASLIRFPYNLSILIGAVFVVLYTFMTGFPPSILRASIMLLFILFGKMIDKNANSLALIFFVGFLMLLFSPKMLFDVGFQLSFAVTIGLVILTPIIISKFDSADKKYKEKFKNSSRTKKYFISLFSPSNLAAVVAIPLVAQLCVIPLQVHYFNNLAPFSILANVAVVPFIGILSFIGFVSSIFALVPVLNEPVIFVFDMIANPLLGLLIAISSFFSSFKISLISSAGFNLFQIFAFWTILLLFGLCLKNNFKNKKHSIILLICVLIFLASFFKADKFKNNLEIIMFDVENADSFLIKTPKNKYFMIDTGKKSYRSISSAQMIMNKYLKNERIPALENMIVTHFDSDHCAGVIDIVKTIKVKEITLQSEKSKSQTSQEIINYIKDNNLNYKIAKNNEEIYSEKDLSLKTFRANLKDDNQSSIVTLLSYKGKNILFMADVGVLGFDEIKKFIPSDVEILKVGHHGAYNSINDEMIQYLKPKYALISAGYSKFNHPHYSTINILEENGVKVISTKNYGFSKIILNDNKQEFYYFDSDKKSLEKIIFKNKKHIPFSKSEYVKNFIEINKEP